MNLRRVLLGVLGTLLILVGIVLLVLPGPGLLVIALGLIVLSLEFDWAKKIVESFRRWAERTRNKKNRPRVHE